MRLLLLSESHSHGHKKKYDNKLPYKEVRLKKNHNS
jgi:hypothetical protein